MKKLILAISLILLSVSSFSRDMYTQEQVIQKLISTSKSIESFSCDFTQVREVAILSEPAVSKGLFQYRKDGRILWRYLTPEAYQLAFSKNEMLMTRNGKTEGISLSENPFMGHLRELLLGLMSGQQFEQNSQFKVSVLSFEPDIVLQMVPLQRQMKKIIREMEISFTSKDCLVSKVVIRNNDNSTTTISFSNRKLN